MTSNERKELSNKVCDTIEKLMLSLYSRWLDEKEYEDINDYATPIKAIIEPMGATLTKMKKKPFGFEFTLKKADDTPNGSTYEIFVKSNSYGFKRTK